MTRQAIRCEGLSKSFRREEQSRAIIVDLDVEIMEGELVLLTGASGAGKSTLLGLLGAMIAPDRGEVYLWDKATTSLRAHHRCLLRREQVGISFQGSRFIPQMSLLENVLLPFLPTGGPTQPEAARMNALLEQMGLGSHRSAPMARLSGGEKQRASIARALALDPPLLLLDEPTAHLDADNVDAIVTIIEGLHREGRTLIVATHDPRLSQHLGNKRHLHLLNNGQLQEGSASKSEEREG